MITINNNIQTKPVTIQPKNSKNKLNKDTYINAGMAAGTTAIGAISGYMMYSKTKNNLSSDLIKLEEHNKNIQSELSKNEEKMFKLSPWKELCNRFILLIDRQNNGQPAEFNNCIMLVGADKNATANLIKLTAEDSNCRFVKLEHTDNILDHLENAEEHYQKTKERTLMHVNKFEQLINPKLTPPHHIADLKDIMSAASEDYHSTIIFDTKDPSTLVHEAVQAHRVDTIDINLSESETQVLNKIAEKTPQLKNDLNTNLNKISNIKNQLVKFPKTKIFIGGLIGLAIGASTGITRYLITSKDKIKTNKNK